MISVISPIYNEEENIAELCERIVRALKTAKHDFEILLVENGSTDGSLGVIKKLRQKNKRIRYISLSRNFGHQGGILAGLAHAKGDAVISMDGDLQHPPEMIPEMIRLWEAGSDVVYTVKEKAAHDDWRSLPSRAFYRLMSILTEVRLSNGQSDFRLLDRRVVNLINSIPERNKFLRGMVQWAGFRQSSLLYKTNPRTRGESKFLVKHYVRFAVDGLFSFSVFPLRVFLWTGFTIAGLCAVYGAGVMVLYLMHLFGMDRAFLPPGWATLVLGMTFLGGVQLIGIGIVGEYVGRIYEQVKQRPDFIVRERDTR